jgi:prepilin-type processing-associated H-X9-DG protein
LSQGPVMESMVKRPSEMIAFGDVPSVSDPSLIQFNANMNPSRTAGGHTECPANRHNYRTDLTFCDGHVESPKRNDVRDPNSTLWRSRWNNDNDPHFELGYWASKPGWENTLDQ